MSTIVPLGAIRHERERPPAQETLRFRISGMHCASCVARVEQAMVSVPGVLAARVNLATQRAEADVRALNSRVSALVRSHLPIDMAAKMLLKPLRLRPVIERSIRPPLVALVRRVVLH